MKIRKIDENTIRFIISQEDLAANEIDLDDLLEHKPKAMNYLRTIVLEAAEKEDFHMDGPFTMMQVRVLQDQSICLTLSQGLHNDLLRQLRTLGEHLMASQNEDGAGAEDAPNDDAALPTGGDTGLPSCMRQSAKAGQEDAEVSCVGDGASQEYVHNGNGVYGFMFDFLEDAICSCRSVPASAQMRSSLYWDEKVETYYLLLAPNGDETDFEKTLLAMNEFGTFLDITPAEAAYIQEHDTCILRENAAAQLIRLG